MLLHDGWILITVCTGTCTTCNLIAPEIHCNMNPCWTFINESNVNIDAGTVQLPDIGLAKPKGWDNDCTTNAKMFS